MCVCVCKIAIRLSVWCMHIRMNRCMPVCMLACVCVMHVAHTCARVCVCVCVCNACVCARVCSLLIYILVLPSLPHTYSIGLHQLCDSSCIFSTMLPPFLSLSTESSSDNLALLQEALVVFREIRRGHQGQGSTPEDDFHLNCEMMAALLFLQNTEAEQYLSDFPTEVCN